MKDIVFIGWSGNKEFATYIKNKLKEFDYEAIVGGETGTEFSIGQAVINQLDKCNQAIMLFHKKDTDNSFKEVSTNLYFELGYALAKYGNEKVHCFAPKNENIVLPSDFENAYLMRLDFKDEFEYADSIIEQFIFRQKLAVDRNKLDLFGDRYLIKEMLKKHHFESKCSDYELAQYILFYLEAAYLFNDIERFNEDIKTFKLGYGGKYIPDEINISLKICELMYKRNSELSINDSNNPYLDEDVFYTNQEGLEELDAEINIDRMGLYGYWAKIFIYCGMSYIYYLRSNDPKLNTDEKNYVIDSIEIYANRTLLAIDNIIDEMKMRNMRNVDGDEHGFLALYKSHSFRNLFFVYSYKNDKEKAIEYLEKTISIRKRLVDDYKDRIDTKIHNNFKMEYYLSIIDKYEYMDSIDMKKGRYVDEMKKYIHNIKESETQNKYVFKITNWCENN